MKRCHFTKGIIQMKHLGASYYPESWGIDRLATDIDLMKDAGVNMVRMGEFAWCEMEPEEGVFDFSLFREVIDVLAENDIDVMMCTPTAAPPAWLIQNYPETLMLDVNGRHARHGRRQHCCYGSEVFRRLSFRIADELSKALSDCENIPVWQIDNELGQRSFGFCHCENCHREFRTYLIRKYETLDNLNRSWKNEFWSHKYSDWEQIELAFFNGNHAVSRVLDSMRFYQKTIKNYASFQVGALRKNIPGVEITTNNPIGCMDLYSIYSEFDHAAGDLYWHVHDSSNKALRLSLCRSFKKKKFFIAETGFGSDVYPCSKRFEKARLNMWRSFAHGSVSYLFFRWRPPLGGQEQVVAGLISPSGKPRRNYQIAKKMFQEIETYKDNIGDFQPPVAQVAIMRDSDVDVSYMQHRWGHSINYDGIINDVYNQMHMRNIAVDFISPRDSMERYKLLILPSQRITHVETAKRIKKFIRSGGVVWALGECHTADENANFTLMGSPHSLLDEFGVNIEFGVLVSDNGEAVDNKASGVINGNEIHAEIKKGWIADLDSTGADVLLRFSDGYYSGQPAVTINKRQNGRAIYQGVSDAPPNLLSEVSRLAIDESGVDYRRDCPSGVEIIDCGRIIFILNNNERALTFKYPVDNGEVVLGTFDQRTGIVEIQGLDICVIKK